MVCHLTLPSPHAVHGKTPTLFARFAMVLWVRVTQVETADSKFGSRLGRSSPLKRPNRQSPYQSQPLVGPTAGGPSCHYLMQTSLLSNCIAWRHTQIRKVIRNRRLGRTAQSSNYALSVLHSRCGVAHLESRSATSLLRSFRGFAPYCLALKINQHSCLHEIVAVSEKMCKSREENSLNAEAPGNWPLLRRFRIIL